MKFVPLLEHSSKEEFFVEVTGVGAVRVVSRAHEVRPGPGGQPIRGAAMLNASSVVLQNVGEIVVVGNPSAIVERLEAAARSTHAEKIGGQS